MLTRSGIKIPKLVRFVFSVKIIFLLIMSLLRILLFLFFSSQGNHFSGVLSSFLLGLRYDLRYTGILGAVLLITGSFSPVDPFLKGPEKNWRYFSRVWLLSSSYFF